MPPPFPRPVPSKHQPEQPHCHLGPPQAWADMPPRDQRQKERYLMLKKEMTREVMIDALEHDYNGLMNLGDIYGARSVDTATDTIHLYEKASSSPAKNVRKRARRNSATPRPHRKSWKNTSPTPRQRATVRKASTEKAPLPNYQEGTILTDRPLLRMQRHGHAQKARPWPSPQHVI